MTSKSRDTDSIPRLKEKFHFLERQPDLLIYFFKIKALVQQFLSIDINLIFS